MAAHRRRAMTNPLNTPNTLMTRKRSDEQGPASDAAAGYTAELLAAAEAVLYRAEDAGCCGEEWQWGSTDLCAAMLRLKRAVEQARREAV